MDAVAKKPYYPSRNSSGNSTEIPRGLVRLLSFWVLSNLTVIDRFCQKQGLIVRKILRSVTIGTYFNEYRSVKWN